MWKILIILFVCISAKAQLTFNRNIYNTPSANIPVNIDLDLDGDLDILIPENDIEILFNNGNGTFIQSTINESESDLVAVLVIDINKDGLNDIVTAYNNTTYIKVRLGITNSTFDSGQLINYPTSGFGSGVTASIISIDINNDGWDDIVAGGNLDGDIYIFSNTLGLITYHSTLKLEPTTTNSTISLHSGLINTDFLPDIVASVSSHIYHLKNTGSYTFQTQAVELGNSATAWMVSTGHFNSDLYLDIISSKTQSLSIEVYYGNSNETFSTADTLYRGCDVAAPADFEITDLNNDNRPDIIVGTMNNTCFNTNFYFSVFLQNIYGEYYAPVVYDYPSTDPTNRIVSGDFNSDGYVDIYAGNGEVYLNTSLSTDLNLRVNNVPTTLCSYQNFSITYEISGLPIASNTYTVQLSNAAGSFAAPTAIGSLSSRAASGTISCTIPGGTPVGSNYRIRVISTSSYSLTIPSTSVTINLASSNTSITGPASICGNAQNISYSTPNNIGSTYSWIMAAGSIADGTTNGNSIIVDYHTFTGGTIQVTETTANGCSRIASLALTALPVPAANPISGPATVYVNQSGITYSVTNNVGNSYVWTVPANATLASGAGTNAITLNVNAVVSNNTLTLAETNPQGCTFSQDLTIAIDKYAQTISGLAALTRTYGDADETLGIASSSALPVSIASDNTSVVSVSGNTFSFLDVGMATITASQAGDGTYHPAPDVIVVFTVSKAPLTFTIDDQSINYGDNITYTYNISGYVNGETVAVLDLLPTIAPTGNDAGTHPITGSGGSDNHYSFQYIDGTLTVAKIPLTITADDLNKSYGAANPTLTLSYTGFVNSETPAVLDVVPTASTTAISTSTPGTYPIMLSGGSDNNYNFTLVDGTLTVLNAIGPVVDVLPQDTGMCFGATVQLDAQLPGFTYRWFLEGTQVSTAQQAILSESGEYILEIEDGLGNIGRDTSTVLENAEPLGGSFLISYQSGAEDEVIVYDISDPEPDSIQWNWGLATAHKIGNQYRLTFPAPGKYAIGHTHFVGYCSQFVQDSIEIFPGKLFPDAGSLYSLMSVSASPNPTSGTIQVQTKLELEDNIEIRVYDVYGNVHFTYSSSSPAETHTTSIDLSGWAIGTYNIRIVSATDMKILKVEKI